MIKPRKQCRLSFLLCLIGFLALDCSAASPQPLDLARWAAQWIWPSTAAIAPHENQFILFRKTFSLAAIPSEAPLSIFADSRYRLWVNGAYIGQGPARAPHYWSYYDTFDVAPKLRTGLNVIAVEVRWYGRGLAWYIPPPSGRFGAQAHGALLCQLAIGAGASPQIIKSDRTWKATEDHAWDWNTPQVNNSLADIEVYHSDRVVQGWTEPQFDDSGWIPAGVTRSVWGLTSPPEEPYSHLAPRPMAYPVELEITPAKVVDEGVFSGLPPRRSFFGGNRLATLGREMASERHTSQASILNNASELVSPGSSDYAEIRPAPAGQTPYVILDMGREEDGYLQFSVESPKPAAMNIGWSEMMVHGDITADEPGGNYVAQYFIAPGSQHWTMWGWHALRFVEVSFPDLSAPLRFRVGLRFSTAKLKHGGSFASSSPLLTKLWQMGAYTFQLCTLDGTMDCPSREQHQWLGDGEIELSVNSVADGNLDIARKFLLDASRDAWRDGAIPMVSDMAGNSHILIDDYIFSFINALQSYYVETGDKDFVLKLYPSVARAMMWFQGFRQSNGLLGPMPYWVFLDWSNPDKQGYSSILNALYAHTLDNAAQLAELAGDRYHAEIFRRDSARVHDEFNQRFWDPVRGLYVDAWKNGRESAQLGQLANADAVLFGLAPADRVAGILAKITDPSRVRPGGLNPATGQFEIVGHAATSGQAIIQAQTYGMFFVLKALGQHGDVAAVRQYIEKFWGPMAAAGNDTFWENFVQASGTSCHAWSAAPTYFLTTLILGVRPFQPGYAEYSLAPHPAGLEWAKGSVPTVHGAIRVDWKWEQGGGNDVSGHSNQRFVMHVSNPPDERAIIALPERNGKRPSAVTLDGTAVTGRLSIT
ncbi:MAG TPA: alpha-L-rhamnosidase N-terminal domain-containing protein, partial [Terriglobia bacterium]|nr:alpha-L-rhamnosidase N-terminal domain-containing protein [Terriglobia bacterium]